MIYEAREDLPPGKEEGIEFKFVLRPDCTWQIC